MASIIIASIALALTLLVYLYGAWRFLRFPRFWVTSAQADLVAKSGDSPLVIENVSINVAFRGGGQARNIIDMSFAVFEDHDSRRIEREQGMSAVRVISIPAELAGRFAVDPSDVGLTTFLVVDKVGDKLACALRVDCGLEPFEIPFTLRRLGDRNLYYHGFREPEMSYRIRKGGLIAPGLARLAWLRRILDWIRDR